MKDNVLNNNWVKSLSLAGGLSAIVFSIIRKSGLKKGIGNYFLFTISGAIIGAGIYESVKLIKSKKS